MSGEVDAAGIPDRSRSDHLAKADRTACAAAGPKGLDRGRVRRSRTLRRGVCGKCRPVRRAYRIGGRMPSPCGRSGLRGAQQAPRGPMRRHQGTFDPRWTLLQQALNAGHRGPGRMAAFHAPPSVQHTPKPLIHNAFARTDRLDRPSASCRLESEQLLTCAGISAALFGVVPLAEHRSRCATRCHSRMRQERPEPRSFCRPPANRENTHDASRWRSRQPRDCVSHAPPSETQSWLCLMRETQNPLCLTFAAGRDARFAMSTGSKYIAGSTDISALSQARPNRKRRQPPVAENMTSGQLRVLGIPSS